MTSPAINYPALAETRFRELCDLRNITRNKAEQDRTGWDYLVEFERTPLNVPHDRQVGTTTARIQVKSAQDGKRRTSLKLSNAKRFTNEPDVCFVVLFSYDAGTADHRIFARHFDRSLIEPTLRRAREADRDGETDLHRLRVPVAFTDADDHTNDLIAWMAEICDQSPEDYAAQKRSLGERIGYEQIAARGKISIRLEDMQALIDASVGLGGAVSVKHAIVQDVRFGIAARAPLIDSGDVQVQILVEPEPARLVVEGTNGAKVTFDGEFRHGLPGMPFAMARAVFKAEGMTAVLSPSNGCELNYEIIPDRQYRLSTLDAVCQFHHALTAGATTTFMLKDREPFAVEWPAQEFPNQDWFDQRRIIIDALIKSVPHSANPMLSAHDIDASWQPLQWFAGFLSDADMTLSFSIIIHEGEMPIVRNFVGYCDVTVGDNIFWAICRRPCVRQDVDGEKMSIVFGAAIVLEGDMTDHLTRLTAAQLSAKTVSMVSRLGTGTVTFNDGNIVSSDEDLRLAIS